MSRATAWFVHAAVLLAGGTGLVYAWMRWLCEPADEFALVNHPLEPDLKAWHILLSPLLVFGIGLLWRSHVVGRLRAGLRERRGSGIVLAGLALPMVVSGYALQVAVEPALRQAAVVAHGASGLVWLLAYLVHQCSPRSRSADRSLRHGRPHRPARVLESGVSPASLVESTESTSSPAFVGVEPNTSPRTASVCVP